MFRETFQLLSIKKLFNVWNFQVESLVVTSLLSDNKSIWNWFFFFFFRNQEKCLRIPNHHEDRAADVRCGNSHADFDQYHRGQWDCLHP